MASSSDGTAVPTNHDSNGAEQTQNRLVVKPSEEEFDYEIWREGSRKTHVKCYSNTGRASNKNESSGMYTRYIKLESPFPFHVLHTRQSLTTGLLTTSRQIYHESVQVLYGANEFEMDAFYELPCIFIQFGNSSRFLRSLRLNEFWDLRNIGKYLEPLVHLQDLSIDMPWRVYKEVQGPAHVADVFFDKAYRWIRGVALVHANETRAASFITVNCDKFCVLRCGGNHSADYKYKCLLTDAFRSELKAAILVRNSLPFPLLKLPRKIQDMIYSHAMVYKPFEDFNDDSVDLVYIYSDESKNPRRALLDWNSAKSKPGYSRYDGFRWSESITPGLLRVNRQIYQESVQILYGKNNFDLECPEAAKEWLDRIGYSHVYLRDVNFSFFPDDRTIFYKLLHVDRLSFYVSLSYGVHGSSADSPEEEAEAFFVLAGHWIESVGSFRGGRAAAIDRVHPCALVPSDEEEQWVSRFRTELKKICG
ncbi:hypothetical protein DIS24_g2847 [Lasiodiplodia hormozganensis]|uniref:Uncharacterized protein n=1 Tax=Lasiodiplodia hormozganensis TaxID=869390 RepID=A0AA39YYL5_9PEZI|nr:hypothetical protein DIS24_g2847 [Lasiodiplodia hormozganensis]